MLEVGRLIHWEVAAAAVDMVEEAVDLIGCWTEAAPFVVVALVTLLPQRVLKRICQGPMTSLNLLLWMTMTNSGTIPRASPIGLCWTAPQREMLSFQGCPVCAVENKFQMPRV